MATPDTDAIQPVATLRRPVRNTFFLRAAKFILFIAVPILGLPTIASAVLTVYWQRNTISPQAISADPTGMLAASQSWSLFASHTDGDWASAQMQVTLPGGATFYNTAPARGGGNVAPSAGSVASFPDVAFDTYVAGPVSATVVGGVPIASPASFGGPSDPTPGTFSVTWGDLDVTPPGTFEIARLTFPSNLDVGTVIVAPVSSASQVGPNQTISIQQIPEPGAAASLGAAAGALLLRRKPFGA